MTLEEMRNFFKAKQEEPITINSPSTREVWRLAAKKAEEYSSDKIEAAYNKAKRAEEYAKKVENYSKEQLATMQTFFCKAIAEKTLRIAELESEISRLTMRDNNAK